MKDRHCRSCRRATLSLCLVSVPLLAQVPLSLEGDPVFGTWVLDRARSTFVGAPAPREQVRIYEPDAEGLKATVITVNADGSETTTSYVAQYDGVEYPFRGGESVDAVIMRRQGPYSAVAEFRHAGRVVGEAQRVISADGNRMTVTVRIRDNLNRIAVFRRKEGVAATGE